MTPDQITHISDQVRIAADFVATTIEHTQGDHPRWPSATETEIRRLIEAHGMLCAANKDLLHLYEQVAFA